MRSLVNSWADCPGESATGVVSHGVSSPIQPKRRGADSAGRVELPLDDRRGRANRGARDRQRRRDERPARTHREGPGTPTAGKTHRVVGFHPETVNTILATAERLADGGTGVPGLPAVAFPLKLGTVDAR